MICNLRNPLPSLAGDECAHQLLVVMRLQHVYSSVSAQERAFPPCPWFFYCHSEQPSETLSCFIGFHFTSPWFILLFLKSLLEVVKKEFQGFWTVTTKTQNKTKAKKPNTTIQQNSILPNKTYSSYGYIKLKNF